MALKPRVADTRGLGLLWAGVLAGPVAWLIQLGASYVITQHACRTGRAWPLALISAAGFVLAVGGGLAAWGARSRMLGTRGAALRPADERRAFLVVLGLGLSLLFA